MKNIIACIIVLCSYVGFAQQNVILIIADDLGSDYCGFSKDAVDTAKMPNIRSLLSKGIVFNNAWAAPVCSPTRAGILTGRYPFRTGVGTAISGTNYPDLDTSEMTIAKLLKYNAPISYATANIGKWHLNHQTPAKLNYPATMGYDMYAGNFLGELSDYYSWTKITNGVSATVNNYATTETINDAINWLGTVPGNKPFFLWLAFNAPHSPYHKPPTNLYTIAGLTGTPQHISQNPKLYFKAMIEAMDTETGRLLQYLVSSGRMDSTNIIFIGDNGNAKRVGQINDTTHAKGTLYEYGLHVPFVISGPAVVNASRSSDALASTPDLFATILEMAGFSNWTGAIPVAKIVDSKSLLPIVKNQATTVRNWIFSEQFNPTPALEDGKAIRNDKYKLIALDNGNQEFYKVDTDPKEQTNLLNTTLTTSDISNYNTLCNELSILSGKSLCKTLNIPVAEQRNEIEIYPNPASAFLTIISDKSSNQTISVKLMNAMGQVVMEKVSWENKLIIDITSLYDGVYTVIIETVERRVVKKVVVVN